MEYKHILVINYTLFNGMTTKLGEKKAKGEWKEQKTNVFPKRTYASVLDPPSHHFPFWSKLCELRHIDKILKNERKQSETKKFSVSFKFTKLYYPQYNIRTSFANLTFEGRSASLALFKRSQSLWQMPHWRTVSIIDNYQCNTRMTTRLLIVKRLFLPPRRWESTRLDFPSPWWPTESRRVLDEKKRICNEATSLEKL